jgi:phage-related protein
MTVVDELVVEFRADITDLKKGLSDIKRELGEVQQSAKALTLIETGEALRGIGQGFTQQVTTPILGFFQDAITASSDAAEEASKFKQVFKELAGGGESWVSQTATEMGRAESTLRSFAASFGAVLSPQFEGNRKAALELSEGYTKLAVDLASFMNVSEEEAKTSLMSAIAGETEPMRRFGVMLNEAAVNAELMAMGLNKTQKEATAAELQQARYNIIMKATVDAQGDAVRTSGGFANSMRALQGAFEQVKIEIGDVLMPIVLEFVGFVKEAIAWFKELDPGIKKVAVVVGVLAAAIGPLLVVFGTLISSVGSIVGLLGAGGLTGALAGLTGPVGLVVIAVAGLAAGFAAMYASSEKFRGMISGIVSGVAEMGRAFVAWVSPIVTLVKDRLMGILKDLGDFIGEQFEKIVTWAKGDGRTFLEFLGKIAEVIKTTLTGALVAYFDIYQQYVLPALKWLLSTALDFVLTKLTELGNWFKSPQTQNALREVGKALGILREWLQAVGVILRDTVIPIIVEFFGYFDSSHKSDITGMGVALHLLWEAYDIIAKVMKGDLAGAYAAAQTFQADFTTAMKTGLIPATGDAKTGLGNVATETDKAKDAAIDAKPAIDGLKSPLDNIKTSANGAAGGIGALNTALANYQNAVAALASTPTMESARKLIESVKEVAKTATGKTTTPTNTPANETKQLTPQEKEAAAKATEGPVNGHGITVVKQWKENGYWWTLFSDGTKQRGAAVTTAPGSKKADVQVNIYNPVSESASKSLAAAKSLTRKIGGSMGVV